MSDIKDKNAPNSISLPQLNPAFVIIGFFRFGRQWIFILFYFRFRSKKMSFLRWAENVMFATEP